MQIEISRSMAANLCNRFDVPVPEFFHAESKEEAIEIISDNPRPYVLKNPICSPLAPYTPLSAKQLKIPLGWIERIDDSEGILQNILGLLRQAILSISTKENSESGHQPGI